MQVSGDVCDAFPPGGPVVSEARTNYIAGPTDGYQLAGAGSAGGFSGAIGAAHDGSDGHHDDGNHVRAALCVVACNLQT